MKNALGSILFLSVYVLLSGCGGGGGGSGGGITLPTAALTLTEQNAPQVAGAAFDALSDGVSVAVSVQSTSPASAQPANSVAKSIAAAIRSAAEQLLSRNTALTAAASSTTYCTYGGTMTVTSTSPTTGVATYHNCILVPGETINGTVTINNIYSTATTLTADTVLNLNIATASPPNTLKAQGDMALVIDVYANTLTLSGYSLSLGNSDAGWGNFGLQNYWVMIDSYGTTTSMAFTFASTRIKGTAGLSTSTPFARTNLYSLFPSSGAAVITGANQTVLKVTVLGDEGSAGNQVQLELSTDGGATYATPTYHTWSEISMQI